MLLLLLCVVHPLVEGTSVAGLQRPCPIRASAALERTVARRAGAKRSIGPAGAPHRLRLLRPLRTQRPLRTRRPTRSGATRRWTGRILGVPGAVRGVRRAVEYFRPGQRVSDISASGLTVAGSRSMDVVQPTLAAVSGVAGVTLAAASALELARARTHLERADAAHGVAWGLQSVGGIGGMWWKAPGWAAPAAYGLGLTGGAIQTAVGLYRLRTGWARRDRRTLILGAIDTGAGASWIASTVTGNPITLGVFFGLTGVRLIYTNAHRLRTLPRRTAAFTSRLVARASGGIDRLLADGDRPRFARYPR